jgi:PDZ domain-containing protein
VFAVGVLAAAFLPAPYVIERPGPAFNVLSTNNKIPVITVADAQTYPTSGALDLLTVSVVGAPGNTPSWLELLAAWLDPAQTIVPLDQMYPPGQTSAATLRQDALMFKDSQQQATAAALEALGYKFDFQVYADSVDKASPALGQVKAGDIIVSAAGKEVNGIQSLRDAVQTTKGKPVVLKLIRGGRHLSVSVTPKYLDGAYRLMVLVGSRYKFPINVNLQLSDIGGPSGGTMFALGIYDKLTPGALTGGQLIAGTGTIDAVGTVGPIGGIRQKMYGAVRAGATWFLAPEQNCNEVLGHIPSGLTVVKIANFQQALAAVKQIAKQHSAVGLPTCTAN